jgi:hypothetical protein
MVIPGLEGCAVNRHATRTPANTLTSGQSTRTAPFDCQCQQTVTALRETRTAWRGSVLGTSDSCLVGGALPCAHSWPHDPSSNI